MKNKLISCIFFGFAMMFSMMIIISFFNPIVIIGIYITAILSFIFGFLYNYKFEYMEVDF